MHTHNFQLALDSLRRAIRLLLAASCCLLLAALTQAQTFSVPGTSGRNWVDTGLDIPPGTLIRLEAAGGVNVGGGFGSYGPEGSTRFADVPGYPAETRYRYGLVVRLTFRPNINPDQRLSNPGQSTDDLYEQWSYGDTPDHQYCAARGGHLWLTVNDDNPGDNSGAFTVTVSRLICSSEADEARSRVSLYTADNHFSRRATRFRVGETIVLKVENNTLVSIYLRTARDPARLIREEALQVERAFGSRYVSVLPSGRSGPDQVITGNTSTSIDYALTELMELRSTMNIARRWAVNAPNVAGSYRLKLVYYDSRNTQTPPRTIYSPTFEVQ